MALELLLWCSLAAGTGLAGLLAAGAWLVRERARPIWARLTHEPDYFQQVLARLFARQGYMVRGQWVHQDPADDAPREVVFALEKDGTLCAALCTRWIVPVTSDVVGRFERALAATCAPAGMIVTTSFFTAAARERARGLPVALYDRTHMQMWIAQA
jgi:hypothetical protein